MNSLFASLKRLTAVIKYQELLLNLVRREISQRYKQSILGSAWVILNPLSQLLVMTFVFSNVLKVPSLGVPFIIFLSVGLLPWNLFANSLAFSSQSLVTNSNLITKIYFPREIFVYATIIAKIVDFFFASLLLVGFLIIFKMSVDLMILWLPLIFLIQIIFTSGLALILAALNLFYRDIQYLLTLILTLWMYLTPIIYPVEVIPLEFRPLLALNPMAVIINAYRQVILAHKPPNFQSLGLATLLALITFFIGYSIFKKLEGQFADYV